MEVFFQSGPQKEMFRDSRTLDIQYYSREDKPLLDIIEEHNLQLLRAYGATIHRWDEAESTVNLIWFL